MKRARRRGCPPIPRVIAHRGASKARPENTRAAFDEALRQGADALEFDVQLSRDGVPYIFHDRSLTRVGGGLRRLARLDAAQLSSLDAGSWFDRAYRGERLMTLRQVLRRYGDRLDLLIEIKARRPGDPRHRELTEAVANEVELARPKRAMFLLCFDLAVLRHAARCAPRLPRILNLKPPRRAWKNPAQRLKGVDALSVDIRRLTPAFAAAICDADRPLFSYTSNRPSQVRRNLECGVDGIMSDRPAWLRQQLQEQTEDAR